MIIDSHCHAWEVWPYSQKVPDPHSRGRVEQLLYEMDQNRVERALIVCAQIVHNPENNAYVAREVQRHPDRLYQLADLDSEWSTSYHQKGAGERLRRMAEEWPIRGFTHYISKSDDGSWLYSEEGLALFEAARELKLIASLSSQPYHQPAIRQVAERFPEVRILCHHLGHPAYGKGSLAENLAEITASARLPNIYIKVSGFNYTARVAWEYPYSEVLPVVKALYEAFGACRMCWGSDYPVVTMHATYQQALEAFRTHCSFVPDEDQRLVLGETLAGMLRI
jgi:L-fuconolactonase